MNMVERRRAILSILEAQAEAGTSGLSRRFDVSEMTIRRDLTALEAQGLVQRTHGGVVLGHTAGAEPRYLAKQKVNATLKARIARYAAERLVNDGDILLMEGGTTVTAMAQSLRGKRDLTVVTNGLYTAHELSYLLPEVTVLCTGGVLRDTSFTFVGPTAEAFFESFRGDKLFVSATGLSLEHGFTDPNPIEAAVRARMQEAAREVVALIDSTKFGLTSLVQTAPADGVNVVVTDAGAPRETLRELAQLGVEVHVVD
ncbi:MAG: DeoR/GlpR family DNA-binding transcription regulator [Bifidobacteriaceae bacterium]|nr:DeoR/GlpR family DNA-binding transcription regulator [Bifidobacteriaceae bacterium]